MEPPSKKRSHPKNNINNYFSLNFKSKQENRINEGIRFIIFFLPVTTLTKQKRKKPNIYKPKCIINNIGVTIG